jgi:pSer/pThr/pTyr-binding forkhead associated (FHA) protein
VSQTQTNPTLVVTGGDLDGTSFVVLQTAQELLLGSSQDCHFQILLGNVEAVHAKVGWGPKGLLLSDALSSAGTYVNGEKIAEEHPLTDGDRISLGPPGAKTSCKLLVRVPAGAALPGEDLVLLKPETGLQVVPPFEAEEASSVPEAKAAPAREQAAGATEKPAPPAPGSPATPPLPTPEEPRKAKPDAPKPDYVTEPPSIAPGRSTARPAARTAAKPAAKPKAAARSRLPLYLVIAVALGGGLFFAFRTFLRNPPEVQSAAPARSEPGQTVSLTGKGFDSNAANNLVRFGTIAATVTSATGEQLTVTIPKDLPVPPGGDVSIVVETGGRKSKPFAFEVYRAPRVTGLEPDVAMPGQEILIQGQNLDGNPLTVNVGGLPAEIKEAVPASVRVVVPQLPTAQGKTAAVTVQIGPDSAKPADLTVGYLPLVMSVSPTQGEAGEKVVIKGRGFDTDAEDNEVYFGNQPALIVAASETEITAIAPASVASESQSTAQVHVKANGAMSSSPVSFAMVRASATVFPLRFYAAAVLAHPQFAFVSTDLGPVMVLGGGETDVEATAARAVTVAATLNKLAGEAGAARPVFEVRQQPETAVSVQGQANPIVQVTSEDALAYELPFEPGVKGKRPSVRGLAAYWAALLQDYFALFVEKGRPVSVLALSPRGKVFSEIYAAAQRVPGASGVPLSVVRPLSASMAKALRDMALILPADKESRVTVAVDGLWKGSLEEASGQKAIEVLFEQRAGRLAGTLTTSAGKVALKTPMRDVSFQKNEVRFTVDISGAARVFTGTVQGGTLAGTIARGSDKAAGRFSLKYIE